MKEAHGSTVRLLERSFYVDDLVTSVNTKTELRALREDATTLMKEAQMNLRCWKSNLDWEHNDVRSSPTLVLGLVWNLQRDTLACNTPCISVSNEHVFTKREVLAITQRVFDPIGFICPLLLMPKLQLQEMWKRNFGWDQALPPC